MTKSKSNIPANEGKKEYKVGYKKPPKNKQFGQPGGNPRGHTWKKEDTPRYKIECMITKSKDELEKVIEDEDASEFEKAIADIILAIRLDTDDKGNPIPAHHRVKAIESLINQVYGTPAQTNVNVDVDEDKKDAFIKGVFIP